MRISDWSSDVCSSDLVTDDVFFIPGVDRARVTSIFTPNILYVEVVEGGLSGENVIPSNYAPTPEMMQRIRGNVAKANVTGRLVSADQRSALVVAELLRSEEHTSELQSLMRISYAVFCLKKKNNPPHTRLSTSIHSPP